jgi:hypothetical protein
MADIQDIDAAQTVKVVGSSTDGTEQTPVSSTPNGELKIADTHNNGGLDTTISVTSGSPVELKVGATRLANRKYVIMEALDTGIKWGFSNSTQSFDLFKSQLIMVPIGENTEIWFDCQSGTKQVSIAELA